MTTLVAARDELAAALVAADVPVADAPGGSDVPYAVIFGEGIDADHIVRGQALATFRATLLSGAWDQAASATALRVLVLAALGAVRELPRWTFGGVRRDTTIDIAGGTYLAADVIASRMVDI
jgi:hypothetical protein